MLPSNPYREIPKAIRTVVPKVATNDLLNRAPSLLQTVSAPQSQSERLPQALMDKLWIKMAEFYGHRWTSSFGVIADPDHTWSKVLGGITGAQLANGLNTLAEKGKEFDWPPPANVFREMCQQVKGLPSTAQAWDEALRGTYSHKAVEVAAEATSKFDLSTADHGDKALFQRFERNYAIVMRRAQTGQPLEGRIAKGITHDSMRPREQIQLEQSQAEADRIVEILEIPKDPKACRAMLLAKLGIRRENHA